MNAKKYTINDIEYNVAINSVTNDRAEVTVNGVIYQVKIESTTSVVSSSSPSMPVPDQRTLEVSAAEVPVAQPAVVAGSGKAVNSPLPGVIVDIKVKVGDKVKTGQVLAVLEAMKMENEIQSEYDGVVVSINASKGDSILEGAPIVTIG